MPKRIDSLAELQREEFASLRNKEGLVWVQLEDCPPEENPTERLKQSIDEYNNGGVGGIQRYHPGYVASDFRGAVTFRSRSAIGVIRFNPEKNKIVSLHHINTGEIIYEARIQQA